MNHWNPAGIDARSRPGAGFAYPILKRWAALQKKRSTQSGYESSFVDLARAKCIPLVVSPIFCCETIMPGSKIGRLSRSDGKFSDT